MKTLLVVQFMDGEVHKLHIANTSWRVCRERAVLIVGRGTERVEMPLCNIRYWTWE